MKDTKALNHRYSVIGWGALFVWWGIVALVDALTLGIGAIGTGLILLGVNAARSRQGVKGFRTWRSNTILAMIAIGWGLLDFVRRALGWDGGASLAMLLIVIGIVMVLSLLIGQDHGRKPELG